MTIRSWCIVAICLVGCDATPNAQLPPTNPSAATAKAVVPPDVQITIIEETKLRGIKRSLDVRLSRRVSEEELAAIATDLKDRDASHYERTFIVYYLTGMPVGQGGWATSHFDPDLQVAVLGTTRDEEAQLASVAASPPGRVMVGTWLNDQPFMAARISIYREGGKTFILPTYKDGSGDPAEVIESQTQRGRRFEEHQSGGDYYLLKPSGLLEIRDGDGVIATLRSVK
jgi:hypothetical protein